MLTVDWLCANAIARANVVAWWERGSRQKVPHFFSFYKSVFLRGLLNHEMPEEDTNQLLSVNSPVAWSWNTLSVRVMWCLPNSGTSGIGLALHVLQSVSDGLLHSFGNCCWYWPSEVVVVSHRRSSKMSWKPITKETMPRRAPKTKIPAKMFNNPLFQSCVIGMRVNKVTNASDKYGNCQTPRHFGYFK